MGSPELLVGASLPEEELRKNQQMPALGQGGMTCPGDLDMKPTPARIEEKTACGQAGS
jgi:hypothetical protein